MKNPFGQIVSFEDYVDIIGIPKEQLNSEEVKNRINKWLVQATEQFDSMISGNGQLGRLYRWFEKLEDNEEDNYKKYKLIKAICSWVETFVIKGKFWVDGLPVINSNVDIQINSSSNDSNVEAKRKDIIQDLVSVGLYQTTNFGDNGTFQDNQQNAEQLIEDLIVLSTSELQQNYLRLNPQKSLEGNLDFANNDLVNGGNIIGSTQHARNNIQYYNIIDSTIDLNRNTVIGSLPQDPTTAADIAQINQNIASINQEQITQNTNISNNANEINTIKAKDIEQNNRLTQLEQETEDNFNEIANIKTKDQQQDNTIQSNTTSINANTNSISTLNQQVANNKNLLDQTIDGLRALKPFQYVGEYQNGTSYNINQLVSYNNNLYLSKEDNNNTIPTSDKWLLINKDTVSVDLSDYYNKLEVDTIKSNLQNDITTNTNSITNITQEVNTNKNNIANLATVQNQHGQLIQQNQTNTTTNATNITTNKNNIDKLNNEVVKIAGNQNITGQKTFTKGGEAIRINPGATGSAYIMGYNDTTKKWAMGCNGSNDFTFEASAGNLILKAPKGFINASKVRISNLGEPTTLTDAATKLYVDNAIKNANLGGGTGSGGSIPQETLNQIETNKNNITDLQNRTNTIETNYLSKNSNALQAVQGSVDFYKNVVIKQQGFVDQIDPNINTSMVNIQYVKNNTTLLTTDQTINGIKTFTNQIVANGGIKTAASQTITSGNLEVGSGSTFAYMTSDDNRAKSLKFSGLSGRGKLDLDMGSASKITNLPDPINNQDAVNKQYVDTTIKNKVNAGWTFLHSVFETEENERYSNLNRWNEQIFGLPDIIDYYKPITVSFTRYNKLKGNGTIPLGTYTGTILYNPNQTHYVVGTNLFYDTTQKGTGNMEQGGVVGLLITPDYIQVQCWDGNDQLGDIKILCWRKTMISN